MTTIVYVLVVVVQTWSGSWLEHETRYQYDNISDCVKAAAIMTTNTEPAPQQEGIRPVTRTTVKYECRKQSTFKAGK